MRAGAPQDRTAELRAQVAEARAQGKTVRIIGGDSKAFYGRAGAGEPLHLSGHSGILDYTPEELVLTARAATPLAEIQAALAQHRQMLPFCPPQFAPGATLGGCVASGLAGPCRPFYGAVRDHVLGVRLLTGAGEDLRFGGQVMKNVAGYDVSRLMAGALGTLGILLEISVKVVPQAPAQATLRLRCDAATALAHMTRWAAQPWPLAGLCHDGAHLYVGLAGHAATVEEAVEALRDDVAPDIIADVMEDAAAFWDALRDQRQEFFQDDVPLWRLSVAPATPLLDLPDACWLDWGGAQRWLRSTAPAEQIRRAVAAVGGHANLFRGGPRDGEVFHPLAPALHALHRRLKQTFDPHHVLNPGRLYPDL